METYFKVILNHSGQGGYNISIGVGKLYPAKNLQEVSIALEHYFLNGELGENPSCPLCRGIKSEMAKKTRGY